MTSLPTLRTWGYGAYLGGGGVEVTRKHLSMGAMVCDWDKTGLNIFYVDFDDTRLKGTMFSVGFGSGSGSIFAYCVPDQRYTYNMTPEEVIDVGQLSIYHATHRDVASGGVVKFYYVKKDVLVKISSDNMMIG